MLSLNDALEKSKKEELIKGSIEYSDIIPYSMDGIANSNKKYCLLKAIEGLATNENINCDTKIITLLRKYVFNDLGVEELQIEDSDVNDLIELRLIASPESSYIEILDRLMFRIYLEKGKCELKGLIYMMYEKYDWAKGMMEKCQDKEKTIIFQQNLQEYNKRFGIEQKKENDEKMQKKVKLQESTEGNWILQKFGG